MYSIISGRPDPDPDVDRRPDPGPARRLRLRAHRRAVHPGHGLADGLGRHPAGGVRQEPASPTRSARTRGCCCRRWWCRTATSSRTSPARWRCRPRRRWTATCRPYRLPFPLDPRQPLSHGPQIHPSQGPPLQLERARAMEDAIPVIREKTDEFAPGLRPAVPALRRGVHAGRRRDRDRDLRRPLGHLPGRDQPAARAGHEDRHGPAAVDPAVPQRRPAGRAARRQGGRGGGDQPRPRRLDLRRDPGAGRDHRPVPRGEPPAGDLVHGRAGRRDRADRRVRVDGRQAHPGRRARRASRSRRTGSGSRNERDSRNASARAQGAH